jgi:hypothetical protein
MRRNMVSELQSHDTRMEEIDLLAEIGTIAIVPAGRDR